MNDEWVLLAFGVMLIAVMIFSMVSAAMGWWSW